MHILRKTVETFLPNFFFEREFLQLELWQWALLFACVLVGYFLSDSLARVALIIGKRVITRHVRNFDKSTLKYTFQPVRLIFLVMLVAMVLPFLDLAKTPHGFVVTTLKLVAVVSVTWLSFRLFDVAMAWLSEQVVRKGHQNVLSTLPLLRRTGKTAIGILAALVLLQNLHVEVTALIAGLGVGGIAVALASQKTLENLFGGVMILLDQPIRVGEECKFGTQQGVIEDIGLRSTRIRTTERSVIAVPNSDLSQMHIENLALRDRIRLCVSLGLRTETTPDQMRFVLVEARKILYAHPKIDRDLARVRFISFGLQSFDIEVVGYVLTNTNAEFLAIKEDILLRIMDVVHQSGTGFALPAQVQYGSEHHFLDPARKEAAEKEVASLRTHNQLPLPEFSEQQIQHLDDTIDYPPQGSSYPTSRGPTF